LKRKVHRAQRIEFSEGDLWVGSEDRPNVGRRVLPPVGLATGECSRLCHVVGHKEPLDPVDLDDLAARSPTRGLIARHVVGVLDIDGHVAGLELFLNKFVRPGAHRLGDLLVWVSLSQPLRHDEGRARDF
jgi:hypothetical protein